MIEVLRYSNITTLQFYDINNNDNRRKNKLLVNIARIRLMWQTFVATYFLFVIFGCGLAMLETMVVLRLNLHAESKPLRKMPAWVSIPSAAYKTIHKHIALFKMSRVMHYSAMHSS